MKVKLPNTEYIGNQIFCDYRKYPKEWGYNRIQTARYYLKVYRGYSLAYWRLFLALIFKRCYYGPFKGEFGNFLAHTLPFLVYLHSKNVKIYYCGMTLHKPFIVDEKGNSIVYKYYGLRDFFREVSPDDNSTIPPPDVQKEINEFENEAKKSIYPYFNINGGFYYWFVHRSWLLNGFMKMYRLEKACKTKDENAVVIFPRSKGAKSSPGNGDPWDYQEIADTVRNYFDKVYIVGHPAFSASVNAHDNIALVITDDNSKILEKCCNSKLIISQHSGSFYLGEYTNTQMLIIFRGKFPIYSVNDSLIFKEHIGSRHKIEFAFSMEEIKNYVSSFSKKSD